MAQGMDLDEVRDLIRFLSSQNDFLADPFSRSMMGSGFFSEEAFEPTRTYVPTPVIDQLRGMAAYAPQSFEGGLAQDILGLGGQPQTPTQILAKLKGTDPEVLRAIIPYTRLETDTADPLGQKQVETIDWDTVEKKIQETYDKYLGEQQDLSQYKQEVNPETGSVRYYEETPSEAAERFRSLGLPLPTDQYGKDLPRPSDFRAQNPYDPAIGAMTDDIARQQLLVNERAQAMRDIPAVPLGTPHAAGMRFPQPVAPAQEVRPSVPPGGRWDRPSTGPTSPGGTVAPAQSRWARPDEGPTSPGATAPDQSGRWARPDTGPTALGATPSSGGASAPSAPSGDVEALMRSLVEGAARGPVASDAVFDDYKSAQEKLEEMKEDRLAARRARADEYRSTFGDEWLAATMRAAGQRDQGRTPLSDTLSELSAMYGLPSPFRPSMDPGLGGGRTASSQQFVQPQRAMNDMENPRYMLNKKMAYYDALGIDPLRNRR